MTPDDYIKIQETNKKLYELALNQEEKNLYLSNMMEAEIRFMKENIPPVQFKDASFDQPLNLNTKAKIDKPTSPPEPKTIFLTYDKVTTENFFDIYTVTSSDPNFTTEDVKKAFQADPEKFQRLCDALNNRMRSQLQQQFGKDTQIFEDDKQVSIKRTLESANDQDREVDNILNRARQFPVSQPQASLGEQPESTPSQEIGENEKPRF